MCEDIHSNSFFSLFWSYLCICGCLCEFLQIGRCVCFCRCVCLLLWGCVWLQNRKIQWIQLINLTKPVQKQVLQYFIKPKVEGTPRKYLCLLTLVCGCVCVRRVPWPPGYMQRKALPSSSAWTRPAGVSSPPHFRTSSRDGLSFLESEQQQKVWLKMLSDVLFVPVNNNQYILCIHMMNP